MSIDLKNPDFTAAVFDLDGTLFDSMGYWTHIDETFLARHGIDVVPEDYLLSIAHLGAEETAVYTKQRFGFEETPEEMMREWHADAVRYYTAEVTMKPGAREYLEKLRGAGIKLAIATANEKDLYVPALERLGIMSWFAAAAEVSECRRKKGFPDIYELACSRMGAVTAETVVFEDIYIGLCGAKDGGFRTVGVYDETSARDTGLIKACTDAFVYSFTELL